MLPEWWAGLEVQGRWRPRWRRWRCWPPPAPWSAVPHGKYSWGFSQCRHPGRETHRRWAWSHCSRSPGPCWRCWWASSPPREDSPARRSRAGSLSEAPSLSWSANKKSRVRQFWVLFSFGTFYLLLVISIKLKSITKFYSQFVLLGSFFFWLL